MHFIVETDEQLLKLHPSDEAFVQIITNNSRYHPKLSWVSLVYYHNGDKGYIICVKHSEAFSISFQRVYDFLSLHKTLWVYDKKSHSYFLDKSNLKDLYFHQLSIDGKITKPEYETFAHKCMEANYPQYQGLNEIIPISKHYEKWEKIRQQSEIWMVKSTNYVDVTDAYRSVEENGLCVTKEIINTYEIKNPEFFIRQGRVYTSYNLYNPTGRPTNAFNSINFLAIPKDEKTRSCFTPSNDYFVEFDFDAYHPRIVAQTLGVSLPHSPLHEYFAKEYFGKDEITPEDYQRSKEITFRQMYGGVLEEYTHIEFFQKMSIKIEQLYSEYKRDGYLTLPTGIRVNKAQRVTPLILFNYWVQNLETLKNYYIISKINNILHNKYTKLVLIAYDAFLFDFSTRDGKELLEEIKTALQTDGMLVKHKWGKTYNL